MESFASLQESDSLNAAPIKSRTVRHRKRKKSNVADLRITSLKNLWAGLLVHGTHCNQIKKPHEFLRELYCQRYHKPVIKK